MSAEDTRTVEQLGAMKLDVDTQLRTLRAKLRIPGIDGNERLELRGLIDQLATLSQELQLKMAERRNQRRQEAFQAFLRAAREVLTPEQLDAVRKRARELEGGGA